MIAREGLFRGVGALPVVVFTSSRARPDVIRSHRAGANGFVIKKVDMGETVAAMKRMVEYRDAMARDLVSCSPTNQLSDRVLVCLTPDDEWVIRRRP